MSEFDKVAYTRIAGPFVLIQIATAVESAIALLPKADVHCLAETTDGVSFGRVPPHGSQTP